MLRSIQDQVTHDYWPEWKRICCPTLIVGGEKSFLPQGQLQEMARRIPHGHYVQVAQAGHDLHLDCPQLWQQIAEAFLEKLQS